MAGTHETPPAERAQIVALGVHRITDRFTANDEAFGNRLREAAMAIIEDMALYRVARKRDAAGTVRLLHKILGHIEALEALLTFVKHRKLALPASVDIVLWELKTLGGYVRDQDARLEEHVGLHHPHGVTISGSFGDQRIEEKKAARGAYMKEEPSLEGADPLLGPDSVPVPQMRAATASASVGGEVAQKAEAPANGTNGTRQNRIIDFFALRRRAPLKEVLELFPDLSEKTVRNDLAELCKLGKIKRVGLAPRSHYILTA